MVRDLRDCVVESKGEAMNEPTIVPFSITPESMWIHRSRSTLPEDEYMIRGVRVVIDETTPENEIRIISGHTQMIVKYAPKETI